MIHLEYLPGDAILTNSHSTDSSIHLARYVNTVSNIYIRFQIDCIHTPSFRNVSGWMSRNIGYFLNICFSSLPIPIGVTKGSVVFNCGTIIRAGPHRAILTVNGLTEAVSPVLQVGWPPVSLRVPASLETYATDVDIVVAFATTICTPLMGSNSGNLHPKWVHWFYGCIHKPRACWMLIIFYFSENALKFENEIETRLLLTTLQYSRRNLVMSIFVFSWKCCCYCEFRAQTGIKWKIWKIYILWSI